VPFLSVAVNILPQSIKSSGILVPLALSKTKLNVLSSLLYIGLNLILIPSQLGVQQVLSIFFTLSNKSQTFSHCTNSCSAKFLL